MSAYVEITFDNSDGRFATGNDEVVLRRTIGLKKDEYSLDRKNATRADVMNMLENAGFSRANPYYIVPQGRVTRITNMKDSERLDLLKSVAGTQAFTAKKEESQKIMNETNNKLAAIDSTFEQINERLQELEEEQEELRNFQEQDSEKRGIEYALFQREQEQLNQALAQIDDRRAGGIDDADENREKYSESEDNLARITEQLESLKQQMNAARAEKKQLEEERRDRAKQNAQVELEVNNLSAGQTAAQRTKSQRDNTLAQVRDQIQAIETELDGDVLPKFNSESQKEQNSKSQLDQAESRQQQLYAKQGRNARFRTKRERDDWLNAQINEANMALSRFKATRMQTAEGVVDDKKAIESLEKEITDLQTRIGGQGGNLADIEKDIQEAKENVEKLMDERKELWRKEAHFDTDTAAAQDQLRRAERTLSHMMDGNTSRGLDAIRRIKQQHNLEGCYGTLAELLDVSSHHVAIEAVAGSSLFHYVVDNDDTATRVLDQLNRERAGRVTFMPLNRLRPKSTVFPNASDMRPLMSLMKYDPKYEKAVQQVFGKAIICQNLTVASQYARTHGLSAVTPEGDRSDKKGALSGGYVDHKNSRLKATKAVAEAFEKFDQVKVEGNDLKKQIERIDQRITKAMGEVQKLEQRRNLERNNQGPLRQELQNKISLLGRRREELEAKQRQENTIANNVKSLSDQQAAHQAELATDFKKALTQAEENELVSLTGSIQNLRRQYSALAASRADIEAQKTDLEVRLNSNLRPQLRALESDEIALEGNAGSTVLDAKRRELQRLTKGLQNVEQQLRRIDRDLESKQSQANSLEGQEAETKRELDELAKAIERYQRRLEKSQQKRTVLLRARQECNDNIRELGMVPDDIKSKHRNADSDKLLKKLHKLNSSLKQFEASGLNRHAVEHYRKSQKSREELEDRRKELEKAKASIQNLIEVLDQRKDEAIERTFKQVSRAFSQIFTKLVPAGAGRLIIQRKSDKRGPDEEESDEEGGNRSSVEAYAGVGISVSFNSKHDDQQRIQQLSGGQKSKFSILTSHVAR